MIEQRNELGQSLTSYGIGGGGAFLASLADISDAAQALAIIMGCFIVFIRLVYDFVKLKRFLKGGN